MFADKGLIRNFFQILQGSVCEPRQSLVPEKPDGARSGKYQV